jgi:hypothetical protein
MVLDRKVLSIALLLFAGVATIYVSLLAATSSVAQVDDPGGTTDQYDDGETSGIDASPDVAPIGGEETLPLLSPVQPLEVDQELEEDAESGDAIPEASVYNTGDGSAVCAPVQQTPVTGNQQTGQENVGIGSEDDVIIGDPTLTMTPEQASACAQQIQPTLVQ